MQNRRCQRAWKAGLPGSCCPTRRQPLRSGERIDIADTLCEDLAAAAPRSSRKGAVPTYEIKALLRAAANRDVGLVLDLEALKKNADAPHAEDGVEAGPADWLEDGVRRRPPVSENVDEVAFGAIELVGGDRSGTAPAQLYSQLKANEPLAVQMCKELLCNLGLGLVGHYPELHEAVG